MRATSIGHAGMLVETDAGSILCDPWFVPAFFGSWFVFPRNDQLDEDLTERIAQADFLYISHLHGDHHDEPWLREHLRRDIPILLPGFPTREQQRTLAALGFTEFVRTVDTEEMEIAPGLTVAIHVETSITDGPGGDSALVVSDGTSILVNQNDCRTNDLAQLRAHGPVDLHWLQFSGAIWYPMVYEMPDADKRVLCEAKVDAQFARAMRYVENVDARFVVPSAGPPAFLDEQLFALNMIDGDELSIFPDQTVFLARLAAAGRQGIMNVPGTSIDVGPDSIQVTHPMPTDEIEAIFTDKRAYLTRYQADWKPWLDDLKASWTPADDRLAGDVAGVVGTAAGDGADTARPGRCERPAPCRRPADPHRLPHRIGAPCTTARSTRSGSTSRASSSKPWSPSAPSTGATRCCCRAVSRRGGRASSTSTSTTS